MLTALFYILEPPSFIKKPELLEVVKGKDGSLHCELYGTPPFQVNWYKEKRALKENHKYRMVSEGALAALHIMKIDMTDAGIYECSVTNNVGSNNCHATVNLRGLYYFQQLPAGTLRIIPKP